MKAEVVTVTPDLAKQWLETNINFRDPIESKIGEYTFLMKSGKWDENGESLKFNKNGNLVDGQNRLTACVQAGQPFTTVVVRDVVSDLNIDVGSKRVLAQWLKHHGCESYAKEIAAALRALQAFIVCGRVYGRSSIGGGWHIGKGNVSNTALVALLKKNQGIKDSVVFVILKAGHVSKGAIFYALHYLFAQKDPRMADEFFTQLGSGEGLTRNDALLHLREKLIADKTAKYKMSNTQKAALTILAWNYWRKGSSCGNLIWREVGPRRQDFPDIE